MSELIKEILEEQEGRATHAIDVGSGRVGPALSLFHSQMFYHLPLPCSHHLPFYRTFNDPRDRSTTS